MTDWTVALGVKPMNLDFSAPLIRAQQLKTQEAEGQQQQFKQKQLEMGAEARGLAPYVGTPEFAPKWAETADRMLNKGLIDPQTHQQWRDNPSPLVLKQMLAQSDTAEMAFKREESQRTQANTDREFKADQAYRGATLDLQRKNAENNEDYTPEELNQRRMTQLQAAGVDPTSPRGSAFLLNGRDDGEAGVKPAMPDETAHFLAERVLAGDTRALIGLGRGAQGAENLTKIQGLVAAKAKERNMDATDILAKASEAAGVTAQQRTFGTQTAKMAVNATEAQGAIQLGRVASDAVPRTNWVPVNKAIQAYQSGTSDPALAKFGAANLAIVNTYARAINPSGTGTVHDKEHAERLLSTATGPEAYKAVLDQLNAEIDIAHKAAPQAKKELEELRKSGKTPAKAISEDEYNSLPSGSRFTAPDGSVRIKP